LFLGSNQLTGSVPQGIWNLSDLATLSLRENQLTGSISSEIGNLTNLTSLDLSRNNLSGSIPPEIGNLTNLTKLFLSLNQLTGPIPPQIGNLANLTELYLSSNQLTGPIPPQIGNLTSLELLTFFGNQLTGSIPSEIGNLTSLRALEFAGNSLMGSIPTQIGNLTNLEGLYLSYNRFTDLPSLVSLSALKDLSIENNSLTFEDIEPNIGVPLLMFAYSPQDDVGEARNITIPMRQSFGVSVSVGGTHNQYQWYKDGSMISGATSNFYTINSVTEGDAGVYTCLITNTVATELTLHSRPITVTIRTFPARTADSLALVALYNSTAGTGWTNRSGWLSGNLESWYGVSVGGGRVTSLDLEGNNLLGSIPSSIGNLRNLTELYLDSNQLTGSIPIEIGNLKNLEYLWLNSNKLDGLPSLSGLSALSELRIERNHFTFEDIEPNVGIASYFSYSDQDSTGQLQDTIIEKESSFVMSVSVAGAHNNYQWKKDGSPISGATSSTYTINSVTTSDEGSYSCDITNTVAAALTLHSRPITVSLDASSVPEIDLPEVYSMNIIKITTGNRLQIRYALPRKASVRFWLYNIQGSKIIDFSEEKPAGYYSREVDMNGVSRGIYFLRIDANRSEFTQTSKFVLM
jgi:Leucine-rich repeat (LRR) protein